MGEAPSSRHSYLPWLLCADCFLLPTLPRVLKRKGQAPETNMEESFIVSERRGFQTSMLGTEKRVPHLSAAKSMHKDSDRKGVAVEHAYLNRGLSRHDSYVPSQGKSVSCSGFLDCVLMSHAKALCISARMAEPAAQPLRWSSLRYDDMLMKSRVFSVSDCRMFCESACRSSINSVFAMRTVQTSMPR